MAPFDTGFPLFVARADNGTVTLPPSATNHGNANLLCLPTKWTDIAIFILGNYVAHAATVVLPPGNSLFTTIRVVVFAMLTLASGAARGYRAFSAGQSLLPPIPKRQPV